MLHLGKEQVLPVPCLGTDEGTWVLLPHHAHTTPRFLFGGLGHGGDMWGAARTWASPWCEFVCV